MTLTQVWGALLIFLVCPLLGGLPLISWITYALTRRRLTQLGTGNISVSAAFYHGGKLAGIFAVLSEAFKGIAAVLLARSFFPLDPVWELIALIALVMGRYWLGKGAGTTNVVWGILVHDPVTAGLVFLIGGISFTIFRNRVSGRVGVLILLAMILSLRHPSEPEYIATAIALSGLLFWIYQKIPDDLDLETEQAKSESQKVFRFFRGDKAIISLNQKLAADKVGQKAANLSQLKQWNFFVPDGWVLLPGDDPEPLIEFLQPCEEKPLVARSSAIGEDSELASAAGQYTTVLNITSPEALQDGILRCLASYDHPAAVQYRRDRQQQDAAMAVLIQKQVRGIFSGVAFSRDPLDPQNGAVVIEALPGDTNLVVSGQVTPQQYRVFQPDLEKPDWVVEGTGDLPQTVIEEIAQQTRKIEDLYHGIPQDIEWTYDGNKLWLLQVRPITTLHPIWTRKIAAEVIPGVIRPLTWSINRPLTCGVWGEIFTLVLGNRATDLDFNQTATLHYHHAYFNATLLGEIFRRMGLPPESLEFLTRGTKFTKPPFKSTLRNLPGLLRLLKRELTLEKDFEFDYQRQFAPTLRQLNSLPVSKLSPQALIERIETILLVLRRATYYSIFAPLSLALRQAIFQVKETELNSSNTPEVASLQALASIAADTRNLLPMGDLASESSPSLFAHLAETPDGESVLEQFQQWLEHYGYLSEVATDIAVPRWQEDPRPVRQLFTQFLLADQPQASKAVEPQIGSESIGWKTKLVQKRLNLKGRATDTYSRLLAHLRFCFVALEKIWLESGVLAEAGEIFFLNFSEICQLIDEDNPELKERLRQLVQQRISSYPAFTPEGKVRQTTVVPFVVYGNEATLTSSSTFVSSLSPQQRLRGIAASPGQAIGRVKVVHNLQEIAVVDEQTILVVPYTDSGWAPLLSRAGGLIAEVGGRLSHGAIVAREYGIPAVMDVHNATHLLSDGQQVRLDGQLGVVEILETSEDDNQ